MATGGSCVDATGFKERTDAAGRAFVEAVSKCDPIVFCTKDRSQNVGRIA